MRDSGPTAAEVRTARDYLAGTLPLEMQTTEHITARIAELHTFQLDADYFEHWRESIGAIERDAVERVAREHLHVDRLAIVVVGNAADIEGDLVALAVGDVIRHGSSA
jgi:zinc protease